MPTVNPDKGEYRQFQVLSAPNYTFAIATENQKADWMLIVVCLSFFGMWPNY